LNRAEGACDFSVDAIVDAAEEIAAEGAALIATSCVRPRGGWIRVSRDGRETRGEWTRLRGLLLRVIHNSGESSMIPANS